MKLELDHIRAGYGGRVILNDVSFEVPEGGIVTLLGANGCGKSTLLKVIGRILRPQAGAALLDGKAVHRCDTLELAKKMAILPQLHHASGDLTVEELVTLGRFPHRRGPFDRRGNEVIEDIIARTRLDSLRQRSLSTLSGGERQRAWIAMTLAQEPKLLLLDEPTTFLDICCQFEIIELVEEWSRERGITVLMVLHDLNLAARCSDLLVTVKDRGIRQAGPPGEVLTPAMLRDIFEIEAEVRLDAGGIPYCVPTGSARKKV